MIRAATPSDVPAIHAMIRELAEYERSLDQAKATEAQLHDALFCEHPAVFALIAEDDTASAAPADAVSDAKTNTQSHPAGFALWFLNVSTWTGTHGVYLEDLYVRPSARGKGLGRQLLSALAGICVERGYERFEWWVLDWNDPSIGFYTALGAEPMEDWTVFRMSGAPLTKLADGNTA